MFIFYVAPYTLHHSSGLCIIGKHSLRGIKPSSSGVSAVLSNPRAKSSTSDSHRGGMGYGIVHQQHIPADDSDNLFRHVASPKTVSVIG